MVRTAISLAVAMVLSSSCATHLSIANAQEAPLGAQNQSVDLQSGTQSSGVTASLRDPVQIANTQAEQQRVEQLKKDSQAQIDAANAKAKELEVQLLEEKIKNLKQELAQKDNAPRVKVYGNKTPTKVGTQEEVREYLKDLEKQRAEYPNQPQFYTDENGNVVTVTPGNNFNIHYEGGYYPPPPPRPFPPYGQGNPVYPPDPVDPGFNHPGTRPPYPPTGSYPPNYPVDPGFNHPGSRPLPPYYNNRGNSKNSYGVEILPPANNNQGGR